MIRLFEAHREAEAGRDIDAILETFAKDCFLETMPLGLRSEGKDAVRAAYEMQFSSRPFPISPPMIKAWLTPTTRLPSGAPCVEPAVASGSASRREEEPSPSPSLNVVPFRDGLMAGELIYFDLATLCEQAGISLQEVRAAAAARH